MLKHRINNFRDDLYGRLMVLNTFQQSIRLIMFQTPIQKTVETCYMHVSWFNRSKKIYELNFFCRDVLYARLMVSKSISSKKDARIERLYNYQSTWFIIAFRNYKMIQKTNFQKTIFKYIPNNKMLKP